MDMLTRFQNWGQLNGFGCSYFLCLEPFLVTQENGNLGRSQFEVHLTIRIFVDSNHLSPGTKKWSLEFILMDVC